MLCLSVQCLTIRFVSYVHYVAQDVPYPSTYSFVLHAGTIMWFSGLHAALGFALTLEVWKDGTCPNPPGSSLEGANTSIIIDSYCDWTV